MFPAIAPSYSGGIHSALTLFSNGAKSAFSTTGLFTGGDILSKKTVLHRGSLPCGFGMANNFDDK